MTAAPRGMFPRRSRLRLEQNEARSHTLHDLRSGVPVARAQREAPGVARLCLFGRPPLKAVEDALVDTAAALFAADAELHEVHLQIDARDGWLLPTAQALGFSVIERGAIPAAGAGVLRISRVLWQDLERGL